MLHAARRAIAAPAAVNELGGGSAIRTEAMPRMPAQQRLAFGEWRQMLRVDETAHRDRAQIGEREAVVRLERLDGGGIEPDREARGALVKSEEGDLGGLAELARDCRREQRIEPR